MHRVRFWSIEWGHGLMHVDCFECSATVEAADLTDLGDRFLAHARASQNWPYPDQGIRNYAEATQRLTGLSERLRFLASSIFAW